MLTDKRAAVVLLLITSFLLSGCFKTKTVVTKVSNVNSNATTQAHRRPKMNGIFYALPRTVVTLSVPVDREIVQRGDFWEFADLFFLGKPRVFKAAEEPYKRAEVTFSLEKPTFSTSGEPDPAEVFMLDTQRGGGFFVTKQLMVEMSESGAVKSASGEVKNDAIDVTIGAATAAASIFAPILARREPPTSPLGLRIAQENISDTAGGAGGNRPPRAATPSRCNNSGNGITDPGEIAFYDSLKRSDLENFYCDLGEEGRLFFQTLEPNEREPYMLATPAEKAYIRTLTPAQRASYLSLEGIPLVETFEFLPSGQLQMTLHDGTVQSGGRWSQSGNRIHIEVGGDFRDGVVNDNVIEGARRFKGHVYPWHFTRDDSGGTRAGGSLENTRWKGPDYDEHERFKQAKEIYERIQELQKQRDDLLSDATSAQASVDALKARIQGLNETITGYTNQYFLGTTNTITWTGTFQYRPSPADFASNTYRDATLFSFSRGKGICERTADDLGVQINPKFAGGGDDCSKHTDLVDSILRIVMDTTARSSNIANVVQSADFDDTGERGFYYRIPATVRASLRESEVNPPKPQPHPGNNAEFQPGVVGSADLAVAQLGVTASLPAKLGGRNTRYALALYESTGGIRNINLGSGALIERSMLDDMAKAATTLIDSTDELKRLKRRSDILDAIKHIKQTENELRNDNQANSNEP